MRQFPHLQTAAILACAGTTASGQSFRVIHPPPGFDDISMYGASGDGSVIAGQAFELSGPPFYTSLPRGYRWTESGGWQSPGIPCLLEGVSGDGTTFVGEEWVADPENPYSARAFFWRPPAAPQFLGPTTQVAKAVNSNGTVIVGSRPGLSPFLLDAYRWTATGGFQILPHLYPMSSSAAAAFGVSADGEVVLVLDGDVNTGEEVWFIWTAVGGAVPIPAPPGSSGSTFVTAALSADGRTVLGWADLPGGNYQACVWSREFGSRFLPVGAYSQTGITGSSFDGSVVSGSGLSPLGLETAFVLDATHGLRDLKQLLLSLGASTVAPYQLLYSNVSWNGRTIVGSARATNFEIYIATVPAFCYGNCDGSTTSPVLNVADFVCFQEQFAAGNPYANCDGSSNPPVLNVLDFVCFQQKFAARCP